MKRIIKLFGFVLLFGILSACKGAEDPAKLDQIQIKVTLQDNGAAIVEEIRNMEMHDYSEMYITMKNLGQSELLDFHVKNYTPVDKWDSEATRIEKADKYGVIPLEDEENAYELVWGVGNYGKRVYEPTYHLSNLVHQLKDGQALFWNFNTFSQFETDQIELIIEAPFPLTEDNVDFYGFGIEGEMTLEEGRLHIHPTEHFDEDNDLTVLMQFPDQSFIALEKTNDQTLDEQKEMATAGSAYNDEPPLSLEEKIAIGGMFGVFGLIIGLLALFNFLKKREKKRNGQLQIGLEAHQKDWEPSAKIPEVEDLADVFFLIEPYITEPLNALFGAYIAKWATEEKVTVVGGEEEAWIGIPHWHDDDQSFEIYTQALTAGSTDHTVEGSLWHILLANMDAEGIVDPKRLESWAEDHGEGLMALENYLTQYSLDRLEDQGYIEQISVKIWGREIPIQRGNECSRQLVKQIDQLVQFYSDMDTEQQVLLIESQWHWDALVIWSILLEEEWIEKVQEAHPDIWTSISLSSPLLFYYPHFNAFSQSFHHSLGNSSTFNGSTAMSSTGGVGSGGGGGGGAR